MHHSNDYGSYVCKTTKLPNGEVLVERKPTESFVLITQLIATPFLMLGVVFFCSLILLVLPTNGLSTWRFENIGTVIFGAIIISVVIMAVAAIRIIGKIINRH